MRALRRRCQCAKCALFLVHCFVSTQADCCCCYPLAGSWQYGAPLCSGVRLCRAGGLASPLWRAASAAQRGGAPCHRRHRARRRLLGLACGWLIDDRATMDATIYRKGVPRSCCVCNTRPLTDQLTPLSSFILVRTILEPGTMALRHSLPALLSSCGGCCCSVRSYRAGAAARGAARRPFARPRAPRAVADCGTAAWPLGAVATPPGGRGGAGICRCTVHHPWRRRAARMVATRRRRR